MKVTVEIQLWAIFEKNLKRKRIDFESDNIVAAGPASLAPIETTDSLAQRLT